MSVGQGSITRTTKGGAPSGFVNIAGARNGASLDSTSHVVLGEEVGDGALPAKLLSSREIPMQGFFVNWFGGASVFSNDAETDADGSLVQVVRNDLQATVDAGGLLLINKTPSTVTIPGQNTPSLRLQGTGFVSGSATSGDGEWIIYGDMVAGDPTIGSNLNFVFQDNLGGQTRFMNIDTFGNVGVGTLICANVNTQLGIRFENILGDFFDLGNNEGSTGDGTLYLRSTTGLGTTPTAFAAANSDDSVNREYYKLGWNNTANMVIFSVEAQGTGVIRPVAFLPNIRYGDNTAPSAIINIAPGSAVAGTGPLKLTAGPLLTVPEDGCIEYDGTNFYKTIGVTRTVIL